MTFANNQNTIYLEVHATNNSNEKVTLLKPTNILVKNQRQPYGGKTTYLGIKERPYELIIYTDGGSKIIKVRTIAVNKKEQYKDTLSSNLVTDISPSETKFLGVLNVSYGNYKFDKTISDYKVQLIFDPKFNYTCVDDNFIEELQIKFDELVKKTAELNIQIEQSNLDSLDINTLIFLKNDLIFINDMSNLSKIFMPIKFHQK